MKPESFLSRQAHREQIMSKSPLDEPALLSVAQVALVMQVSTRTVWRLVSSGELIKPLRVRGNTRWRRVELESWIESGCLPVKTNEE